jgi:L-asparaginase/Glu-tRNA(Gln) amidotransferase subunit D
MRKITEPKTLVVITGGTCEALYDPAQGTPHMVPLPNTVEDSAIPELIAKLGRADEVDFLKLGMTDSKDMSLSELDATLYHAMEEGYDRVVIVQGTDTMPLHAQYLKKRIAEWSEHAPELQKKTFVFTGAMKPLRDAHGNWHPPEKADLWQNMPRALDDAKAQKPGVYIEMGDMPGLPKGPWEADTVDKQVVVDAPGSRVAHVVHSAFVVRKPPGWEVTF